MVPSGRSSSGDWPRGLARHLQETAGTLVSIQDPHAGVGQTLRHWTIDSGEVVRGSRRPAVALPFSEQRDGGKLHQLALRLARVKSGLERRVG